MIKITRNTNLTWQLLNLIKLIYIFFSKARLTTKFDANFVAVSTPNDTSTNSSTTTPKRHHSFANQHEVVKKVVKTTMSLDRHTLKPLNLDGICNGTSSNGMQPLLAIVDDKNNIQVMFCYRIS